jgi:hypothetical protein|uniref:Uncharacterized protein n=1 Tax=Phaeodactylum tricornutum TaxID=2850 RepID=A0A8J9TDM9_PHATR
MTPKEQLEDECGARHQYFENISQTIEPEIRVDFDWCSDSSVDEADMSEIMQSLESLPSFIERNESLDHKQWLWPSSSFQTADDREIESSEVSTASVDSESSAADDDEKAITLDNRGYTQENEIYDRFREALVEKGGKRGSSVRFDKDSIQVQTYEPPCTSCHSDLYYSCHQLQRMIDENRRRID